MMTLHGVRPYWHRPSDHLYTHPSGELRLLLWPDPLICVRLEPDHGIEAAINRTDKGYIARVVIHKTVINFGHKRLKQTLDLVDAFIMGHIAEQREALMRVRTANLDAYRSFLPEFKHGR